MQSGEKKTPKLIDTCLKNKEEKKELSTVHTFSLVSLALSADLWRCQSSLTSQSKSPNPISFV